MGIDIYTCYTVNELRKALALARHIVDLKIKLKNDGNKYHRKESLERMVREAESENVTDRLEYIFRDITRQAWLVKDPIERSSGQIPGARLRNGRFYTHVMVECPNCGHGATFKYPDEKDNIRCFFCGHAIAWSGAKTVYISPEVFEE